MFNNNAHSAFLFLKVSSHTLSQFNLLAALGDGESIITHFAEERKVSTKLLRDT